MLILLLIEYMLSDLGCESVTTAATVDQALKHITSQHFDVAMLDMNLAGVGSEAVAAALAAQHVPFIYSTGNTIRESGSHGDRPVLRKPFKADELRDLLANVLGS